MKSDFKKDLHIIGIIIAAISFLACVLYLDKILVILKLILSAFSPFLLGLAIAFILNLPLNFFEKRVFRKFNHPKYKFWNKIKRGVCIVLSVIIVLGALSLLFSFVIPAFVDTAQRFIIDLPDQMEALMATLESLAERYGFELDLDSININWDSISNFLLDYLNENQESITVGTIDALIKIFRGVFNFVLGLAFSIYILASKENLAKLCKRFIYSTMKRERAEKTLSVVTMSSKVFAGFVSGQCIEVTIIGCLCFIGMLILKMPYAPMISCIIAITAFVPVFGPLIGTIVGAFIILLESPIQAFWFVVFIIVLQQIESNAIYPKIMGKSVGLPGIWVLLAVTVGGSLFGVAGMLFSVPTCSVLYCLFEAWLNKRLNNRKICTHTFVDKDDEEEEAVSSAPTVTIRTKIKEVLTNYEKNHKAKKEKTEPEKQEGQETDETDQLSDD